MQEFKVNWSFEKGTSISELVKFFFFIFDAVFMNEHFLIHGAGCVAVYMVYIWYYWGVDYANLQFS